MTTVSTELVFERRGVLGLITLNRPRQLNALSFDMVHDMLAQLEAWAVDDGVATVAVRGAGERGLCAGGDVSSLVHALREGNAEPFIRQYFGTEYRLDHRTSTLPKPYVGLMDGITLGGGVGISGHAEHRVVTERSKVGMPETGIGIVPDVGGTWLLSRAPGGLGVLMTLTGDPVGPAEAIAAGFADVFVPSDRLDELVALLESLPADEAIGAVRGEVPPPVLPLDAPWLRALHDVETVEAAIGVLDEAAASGDEHAARARASIETRSPTSLRAALEALRRVRGVRSLAEALVIEYRLITRLTQAHDFSEGVRAALLDKDRDPHWSPASLAEVDQASIDALFEPAPGGDLIIGA